MASKYLIFLSEDEAISREAKVTAAAKFSDGVTERYAEILKHPTEDKWALVVEKNYEKYFTKAEIKAAVEIDWFN